MNGFVCTKNIAHKKVCIDWTLCHREGHVIFVLTVPGLSQQMNPYIKNPKILLLKCSIEYLYREETKFTCIDPIVLQVTATNPYMISVNVICTLSSENTLKIQESEKSFNLQFVHSRSMSFWRTMFRGLLTSDQTWFWWRRLCPVSLRTCYWNTALASWLMSNLLVPSPRRCLNNINLFKNVLHIAAHW